MLRGTFHKTPFIFPWALPFTMPDLSKEDIIRQALKRAKNEGFRDPDSWSERELLCWYKSLLKYENKKVPKILKKYKDDIS